MKTIHLGDLSRYRTELMGLSAVLILICHAYAYVELPEVVRYMLSLGNMGVDLFLFLSGMGMWYSLSKNRMGGGKILVFRKVYKVICHVPCCITTI